MASRHHQSKQAAQWFQLMPHWCASSPARSLATLAAKPVEAMPCLQVDAKVAEKTDSNEADMMVSKMGGTQECKIWVKQGSTTLDAKRQERDQVPSPLQCALHDEVNSHHTDRSSAEKVGVHTSAERGGGHR